MNKKSFTMADRRSSRFHISDIQRKAVAFTMAEILLSLTIIGVVAAITLPSLMGNINERTWNTQRKALYARMSQAVALMGSLNGYGIGTTESDTASNAAKAFVTNGLAKVYKINNICDADHLGDCGIPENITKYNTQSKINVPKKLTALNYLFNVSSLNITAVPNNSGYSQLDTYVAAFETNNGENIVAYYNPFCTNQDYLVARAASSGFEYKVIQPTMCVNFIYDLNGKKGPNAIGKDVGFMTVFYPTDSQVAAVTPLKLTSGSQWGNYNPEGLCRKTYGEEARAANVEELKSLFINRILVNDNTTADTIVSKTKYNGGSKYYSLAFWGGWLADIPLSSGTSRKVYCIKN